MNVATFVRLNRFTKVFIIRAWMVASLQIGTVGLNVMMFFMWKTEVQRARIYSSKSAWLSLQLKLNDTVFLGSLTAKSFHYSVIGS